MKIQFNVLDRQYQKFQKEYDKAVLKTLRGGFYVLGPEVDSFEREFAKFVGVKHCVGLASGLDALWIGLKVLGVGPGDSVLVQSNAYIATVMAITMVGAEPIFVEPDENYNMNVDKIEESISNNTKAVIVTHLYGQPTSRMDFVQKICKEHNLYLVEDCAQGHGSRYDGKMTGSFGDIGCFSFYPSKNLGCFGDGGAITTNSEKIANDFRVFRNYGSEKRYYNKVIGTNSRLDELQAALLRVKLKHLKELQDERDSLAKKYLEGIKNPLIKLPLIADKCVPVWHLFVVRCEKRDELIKYLEQNNIQALIHYPVPPHLQEAYRDLGYKKGDFPIAEEYANTVVSLPLYIGMTDEEIEYVIEVINRFEV
ncbi:DegT/DnrJ/EryC1/StrS family aminotransferase [Candidatus Saccharibacteria bacterium]|nr:DegT/DnrJ/EryC1/StrS family aminotransferase [Candidatus Saccharibacteria bacterium]